MKRLIILALLIIVGVSIASSCSYWYLVHNDDLTVFTFGYLDEGLTIGTNHTLEKFDAEVELETRVDELKGEGWYAENKDES